MLFGLSPFAVTPFGGDDINAAVDSPFQQLLNDQTLPRAYLFLAKPYDGATSALTEVRASVGLDRPIKNSKHWPSILITAVDSKVNLTGQEILKPGTTSFGNIELSLAGGEFDNLTQLFWDSRDIEVLMGAEDFTYSEFSRVLFGSADGITYDKNRLSIVFRGRSELLNVPIQTSLYAGTGGLEGGNDIAGTEKPLVYGYAQNVKPVLVDRVNQIYQINDGAINSVLAAFDGGAALTFEGDVSDITATTVSAGSYKTQLSGGYIRLGAEPAKALTVDVKGDSTPTYVYTAADIIQRIVETKTALTASDIDLQSISTTNLDNSAVCGGVFFKERVDAVITQFMESIGGAWTFDRQGRLRLSVIKKRSPIDTITDDDMVLNTFNRVRTKNPSWRRILGYAKSWLVQSETDVVGSATTSRKDFIAQEYRFSVSEDTAIKTRRAGAQIVEKNTLLQYKADADAEVVRQQGLFGSDYDRMDVAVRDKQFKLSVGDTVMVRSSRFSLNKPMIVVGIRETTRDKRTALELWG